MTVPNPLLTFTESEFTKGVFIAETKFGEVKIVGDEDTDFIIFGPRGECIDAGERRVFLNAIDRATFLFGG